MLAPKKLHVAPVFAPSYARPTTGRNSPLQGSINDGTGIVTEDPLSVRSTAQKVDLYRDGLFMVTVDSSSSPIANAVVRGAELRWGHYYYPNIFEKEMYNEFARMEPARLVQAYNELGQHLKNFEPLPRGFESPILPLVLTKSAMFVLGGGHSDFSEFVLSRSTSVNYLPQPTSFMVTASNGAFGLGVNGRMILDI